MLTRDQAATEWLPGPVELRRRRLDAQLLVNPAASVSDVARRLAGLQAQDTRMARLLVRPRTAGLDAAAVERACNEERSVVRTWAMRGTLHMVAADDVRWLVGLFGLLSIARGRRRRRELGLDDDLCARATDAIADVLSDSAPRTRAELLRELAGRGIGINERSQAPAHLVAYAAHRGTICRGPDLAGDEPTYVLLDEWVGARPLRPGLDPGADPDAEREAAVAELARRYVAGYASADAGDFAAWSGLPVREARVGLTAAAGSAESSVAARPVEAAAAPRVHLLGHFDPYLLGYRDRGFALDPKFAGRIQRGGGFILPTVVVDGRIVGTWRQQRAGRRIAVVAAAFEGFDKAVRPGLEAEAADIGRFLGADVTLQV